MYSSPRIKNKLKFRRHRLRGQHKKYAQKFDLEQIVRRPPLGKEGKCDCNINVNDSATVLEDWRWAELDYGFIKLWTSGLVTLSLLCP
jgi:hypothetical protein